jgi:hypothetical protein
VTPELRFFFAKGNSQSDDYRNQIADAAVSKLLDIRLCSAKAAPLTQAHKDFTSHFCNRVRKATDIRHTPWFRFRFNRRRHGQVFMGRRFVGEYARSMLDSKWLAEATIGP